MCKSTTLYILNLGISPQDKEILQTKFLYIWKDSRTSYLGITLTPHPQQLFNVNYLPLEKKLREGLQLLNKHTLSWSGRHSRCNYCLNCYMYTDQYLYLYTQKNFHTLQYMLSRFLWEGNKAQSAFANLSKTRGASGVGLPNLTDYHLVTILAQLRGWFPNSSTPL